MHLITTQFIFASVFLFILYLSTSLSKLMEIYPTEEFREECAKDVKSRMPRGFVGGDSPRSQECMLYCGYKKIGMIHFTSDLNESWVSDNLSGKDKKKIVKQIRKCASSDRGPNICTKARKNTECYFKYKGTRWVEIQLKHIMQH